MYIQAELKEGTDQIVIGTPAGSIVIGYVEGVAGRLPDTFVVTPPTDEFEVKRSDSGASVIIKCETRN